MDKILYEITDKPFVSDGLSLNLTEENFYRFKKMMIEMVNLNEEQTKKLRESSHIIIRSMKEE